MNGCQIWVRVTPRARTSAVVGVSESRVSVRVPAPPVDGSANAAACLLVARAVGVRPAKVRVVRGEHSREKLLSIAGVSAEVALQRLRGAPA